MSKLSDAIVSAILKRGVIFEGRNIELIIPIKHLGKISPEGVLTPLNDTIDIMVTIDHASVKLEKENNHG